MGCLSSKDLTSSQVKVLISCNKENTYDFSLNGISTWAKVVDAYDGDTFRLMFYMKKRDKDPVRFVVRGNGYNAPEMYPPKSHYDRKTEMTKAIFARNRFIQLSTDCDIKKDMMYSRKEIREILRSNKKLIYVKFYKFGKFGRVLADVYEDKNSDKSINQILIDEGYAVPYNGEGRDKNALTV